MCKKTLDDCKSGKDFAAYVYHHPAAHDIRQTGSHLCAKGPNPGTAVIPVHNGDLPGGTRRSVIKMLLLVGLGLLFPFIVCNLSQLLASGGLA